MPKAFYRAIFLFVFLAMPFSAFPGQPGQGGRHELIVFYAPGCHECAELKNQIMPRLQPKIQGRVKVTYRNLEEINSYQQLLGLQEQYRPGIKNTPPILFLDGHFLEAGGKSSGAVQAFIDKAVNTAIAQEKALNEINLLERFKAFGPAVIFTAGLIDGINPCAFTVIVFFISFLALQGYRKKELALIGFSFIFSVFITYIAIGAGLFSFLFSLKPFWALIKGFNIAAGIFSIILGVLALYDFFFFKKSKNSEDLLLQLPPAVKRQIHKVIGLHYRKAPAAPGSAAFRNSLPRLILSALVTGFLVSLLEAVCTGQTYLPTIVFVLKTTPMKLQALAYLLFYNLMFILPLVVIFMIALGGATSERFSIFFKRHLLKLKILMAALFFVLGALLIWRA